MPTTRPKYLQGEDIELTVEIDPKYLQDADKLFAYAYYDDKHHLLTSTQGEFIQMTVDEDTSSVTIHISNAVTANPDICPVGVWCLEIMVQHAENSYREIYQNLKAFEIKKSYIVFSGDVFINQNVKMAIQQLNHYRGETIVFRMTGDNVFVFSNDENHRFKVLVYPDGLDLSVKTNLNKLRTIDSSVVGSASWSAANTASDGFVEYPDGTENEVHCTLPWERTQDMEVGSYTLELLYGTTERTVSIRNNAFTMIESGSENVGSDYKLQNINE